MPDTGHGFYYPWQLYAIGINIYGHMYMYIIISGQDRTHEVYHGCAHPYFRCVRGPVVRWGGGRGGSISICSCFNGHNSTPRAYLESDGGGGMALELPVVAFVVEQVVIIYWLDIRTMH